MDNILDHFTVVHELVKYIKWNDIHNFKRLNNLCKEVCEREMNRRCRGIMYGYTNAMKDEISHKVKRLKLTHVQTELHDRMQYFNPSLVLLFTNKKNTQGIDEIIGRQCNSGSIICRLYSNRGCFGVSHNTMNIAKNTRNGGVWWLSLPSEASVSLVTKDNETIKDAKLILVFNASLSTDCYCTNVFHKNNSRPKVNPVIYCGGLVRGIELYDHEKRCFEKMQHVAIALGGEDLHVDYLVLDEGYCEAAAIRRELSDLRARNDDFVRGKTVKHQCVLTFSCYYRNSVTLEDDGEAGEGPRASRSEYDLFAEYFPGLPMQGVFCEGEIFHVREGVLRLVKSLSGDDLEGLTSIYVLLTWAH